MKKIRNFALAGCSLLLLCQCATREDVMDLTRQLRAVNQRVEDVRGNTVNKMQRSQASSVNRLDEVSEQFLQLKTMVEESNIQSSMIRESVKDDVAVLRSSLDSIKKENDTKIQHLEEQLSKLSQTVNQLKQAEVREAKLRSKVAAEQAEYARKRTVMATAAGDKGIVQVLPDRRKSKPRNVTTSVNLNTSNNSLAREGTGASTSQASSSGNDPFKRSMDYFNQQKYKEAYKLLEQFSASNPQGGLASKTLFYMGESLFLQEEYDLAILDYQKVISNYPQTKLAPTALLKQGMAFEELTDIATAKLIYQKLIGEFSGSPESQKAAQRLEKLN